jgi:hypothetical protein
MTWNTRYSFQILRKYPLVLKDVVILYVDLTKLALRLSSTLAILILSSPRLARTTDILVRRHDYGRYIMVL